MNNLAQQINEIDLTTDDARRKQTALIMALFDRWKLTNEDQLNLLGLSTTSRAMLGKYRKGGALSLSRDMQDRVGWLLAIHKALRLLFPRNEALRYGWVKRRNKSLNNLAPLDLMKEEGLIGIAKVARYLDFQRGL
jgi:hypothetical protein